MELTILAGLLRMNELAAASLYRECARLFPDFAAEFEHLACEEDFHAAVLQGVAVEINENPQNWREGKVSCRTVQLLNDNLQQALQELRSGKVNPRYGITVLRSFEQSMSERAVSGMLINDSAGLVNDLRVIDEGFSQHLTSLCELEKRIFGSNSILDQFQF